MLRKTGGWFAVVLALAALPVSTAPGQAEDKAAIRKLVFDAQRAGLERHDLKAYLSQWSDDAKIIGGRGSKAGKYDVVLDRQQIEATRRLRFGLPAPTSKATLSFQDVKIEVDGEKATMHVTARIETPAGDYEAVKEIYRLRRSDKSWRVYENRYWMIEMKSAGQTTRYDSETWKNLDDGVERSRRTAPRNLLNALYAAQRWKEAHRVAKQVTQSSRESGDWLQRAYAALLVGDAADARAAFRKAADLDPDAIVPMGIRNQQ